MEDTPEELELKQKIETCFKCPIAEKINERVIVRGSSVTPHFMFIGEAPGRMEDKYGSPFVGPSGRILQESLDEARITSYVVVNIIKCKPLANSRPYEPEYPTYLDNCEPFLRAQIELYKPMTIVVLGTVAAERLLGQKITMFQDHGKYFQVKGLPPVYVTYHPSPNNASFHPALVADLKTL